MTTSIWLKLLNEAELEHLHALKDYHYQGIDHSLLSRWVYNPLWNWMLYMIPSWVAPNTLTLLGLILTTSCAVVTVAYPDLPKAWFAVCGLCYFLYSCLDALDGKQARRTHSSSPLGELFDHGCDSLNVLVIVILSMAAMGIPITSWWFITSLYSTLFGFYICTWEEYYTHILYLPLINGPVEGATVLQGLMFLAAWKGPTWLATTPVPFHVLGSQYLSLSQMIILLEVFCTILQTFLSVSTVLKQVSSKQDHELTTAVTGLYSFLWMLFTALLWIYHSPMAMIVDRLKVILFAVGLSLSSSLILTRIILGRVIQGPFPHFSRTFLLIALGAANAISFSWFDR
jgi:ethanolaminephosphotransferase